MTGLGVPVAPSGQSHVPSPWTDPIPLQCVLLVEYWQEAVPVKPFLQTEHESTLAVPPLVPVRCCRSGKGQVAASQGAHWPSSVVPVPSQPLERHLPVPQDAQGVQVPFCVGLASLRYSLTWHVGCEEHCVSSKLDLPVQPLER